MKPLKLEIEVKNIPIRDLAMAVADFVCIPYANLWGINQGDTWKGAYGDTNFVRKNNNSLQPDFTVSRINENRYLIELKNYNPPQKESMSFFI